MKKGLTLIDIITIVLIVVIIGFISIILVKSVVKDIKKERLLTDFKSLEKDDILSLKNTISFRFIQSKKKN